MLICACLHPLTRAALSAPLLLSACPLFSCCLQFPFPCVHLASAPHALNTWMLSALIMPSSDWANQDFLGEFPALISFPEQHSGSSLALGRVWHTTASQGQHSLQLFLTPRCLWVLSLFGRTHHLSWAGGGSCSLGWILAVSAKIGASKSYWTAGQASRDAGMFALECLIPDRNLWEHAETWPNMCVF